MDIQRADIFLTKGSGFISKAIRFFSRHIGESRTRVNHVGVVIVDGNIEHCEVVEALSKVKHHTLWARYGPKKKDLVGIYRPLNLTEEEKQIIVDEALEQVDKKYGYLKIVTHMLDWILQGAYVFRRLTQDDRYPICSWLVAHAFSKANKHFGVEPGAAQPDDIWDFVVNEKNRDKYECIHALKRIW
ncbi:MAG: YiiX/YebB-like N1pC/P60 family cysteine hydrolase [bacterium]